MTENRNGKLPGQLLPLVHLSNNWISLIGVVVVTSTTVFWLFLLPFRLLGIAVGGALELVRAIIFLPAHVVRKIA